MNAQAQTVFETMQRPRALVCGVCSTLAAGSGMPVWVLRAAALVLLLVHAVPTGVAYLLAAAWLRAPRRQDGAAADPASGGPGRGAPMGGGATVLADRFRRLDERLARMEEAAWHDEARLRRAFHDLERRG